MGEVIKFCLGMQPWLIGHNRVDMHIYMGAVSRVRSLFNGQIREHVEDFTRVDGQFYPTLRASLLHPIPNNPSLILALK